ncbi:unnamed protein product [Musa textilis]
MNVSLGFQFRVLDLSWTVIHTSCTGTRCVRRPICIKFWKISTKRPKIKEDVTARYKCCGEHTGYLGRTRPITGGTGLGLYHLIPCWYAVRPINTTCTEPFRWCCTP